MSESRPPNFSPLRNKIHEIIFGAHTPAGKSFDILLMVFIVASVLTVMLETVDVIADRYHNLFYVLEWTFTIFFTIEYILRLYCVYRPIKYATSFYGIIDLLAILPTYISYFFVGTHYLVVIRTLRLMRIFRIFKLGKFMRESSIILIALRQSRAKITVFLVFILLMVTIVGSVMYLVEGGEGSDFTSIPRSVYWAVVTLTTVGYGDIAPTTELGQFLAGVVMIMGYAVIAVPTGIVSSELIRTNEHKKGDPDLRVCHYCASEGHDEDAVHCKYCGEKLDDPVE